MRGVRGDMATPGDFRRSQNWIGPPGCSLTEASYVPPPADELMTCLDALERFLHDDALPPLVHAGLAHAQFEAIHPFLDGNGRVGRLLITLLLVERQVLPSPLLYLSAYFEATREEYYAHLLAVTRGRGLGTVAGLFPAGRTHAGPGRPRPHGRDRWPVSSIGAKNSQECSPLGLRRRCGLFVENPFWTVGGIAGELGVAYTTAQRAVERLQAAGIVSPVGTAKRNRIYCARDMLEVLEAPRAAGRSVPKGPTSSENHCLSIDVHFRCPALPTICSTCARDTLN